MERIVTIDLFGESYRFETDSNPEKAKKIAELLLEEVMNAEKTAAKKKPEMAKITILIIAALNIATQNFELKAERSDIIKRVSDRSSDLIQMIDAIPL